MTAARAIQVATALAALYCGACAAEGNASGSDMRALIQAAVKEGAPRVVIPPGVYRLGPAKDEGVIITLQKARNLDIIADGVTMVCTRRIRALIFLHCENVTLRGLTVDYDPLTFTQGSVVSIAGDKGWLDVKLDAGYPQVLNDRIVICDPKTRFHKYGINHLWGTQASWKEPGTIRITLKNVAQNVDLGDPVALSGGPDGGLCHGITVEDGCSNITFQRVTLHCAPGMGIIDAGSNTGLKLSGCRIVPGPKPPGATAERLLTTSWDGIQCNAARKGSVVEDCVIERCGDDSWSVTAGDFLVLKCTGAALVISPRGAAVQAGDRLKRHSGPEAAVQTVREVRLEKAGLTPDVQERFKNAKPWTKWKTAGKLLEVTLDHELGVEPGDCVYNADCRSHGFVFRNNRIYSHGRGALVKSGDGLIEGNLFRGGDKGIVVNPELPSDAGGADNLIIRNNTIRETGYHQAMPWSDQAGAVCLSAGANGKLRPPGMFNHILIENNTFDTVKGLNLLVSSCKDVVVKGNRFLNTFTTDPGRHNGADYGIDASAVIMVTQSENVTFENNVIEGLGPFAKHAVAVDPSAQHVSGAEDGVAVKAR